MLLRPLATPLPEIVTFNLEPKVEVFWNTSTGYTLVVVAIHVLCSQCETLYVQLIHGTTSFSLQ